MSNLVALDVAILPPPDVSQRAVDVSRSLPAEGHEGLELGPDHLPHITLTQQFVREDELGLVYERVGTVLHGRPPLRLTVTGGASSGHSLWLAVERTPELDDLHEQLMDTLRGIERSDGGPGAFAGGGRLADVLWVASYRLKSSFGAFAPHITVGHGDRPPDVEPFTFEARTVAACHLGRFCTCRSVLRRWTL